MPLSVGDLAWVRSEVGSTSPPTDADLDGKYDRLGSPVEVALEVLRGRLADFLADPVKWSLDGEHAEDSSANIKALSAQIARLEASMVAASVDEDALPGTLLVGRFYRSDHGVR